MKFLKRVGLIALALVAFVAAPLALASSASAEDHAWGYHKAVSAHGYSFYYAEGADETDARNQAMFNCQVDWGSNGCIRGTSVPYGEGWEIVGIVCGNNGRPITAGSEFGNGYSNAIQKAKNAGYRESQCSYEGSW